MPLSVYGAILFLLSSPLVVLSNSVLNRVEVVRHYGNHPSADAFSNPGCHTSYCGEIQGAHCYTGACCKCQCPNNKANYIVNKWECVSRNELNQMNSTKCKYSIRKPGEPILGLPLTEEMVQEVSFADTVEHRTLIPCNGSIQIGWKFRNAFGDWKDGDGDIFRVSFYTKNGAIRDQRVITAIKWTGKLRSDYAGLLIKFSFKCKGKDQGCALAKIEGNHIYDTTRLSTVRPPPVIPTTTKAPETTTKSIPENNTNAYQQGNENQASTGDAGNASAIFGPILGVLGLICLIGVVCVLAAKYRKRKRNQDHETNSVAKLEEYQDPIYADINKGDFDNPVYCDPTLDPAYIRASLGPLPRIPGSEAAYEPLNSLTRNAPDYDTPVNGAKPEVDYDNPPVGIQNRNDYDNPPVTGGMENTEDYDNPPVKGGTVNTADYDNPPVKGEAEINQDYDNPPAMNDNNTPPTDNSQSAETDEDTFF